MKPTTATDRMLVSSSMTNSFDSMPMRANVLRAVRVERTSGCSEFSRGGGFVDVVIDSRG